jgi:hypothetical protein
MVFFITNARVVYLQLASLTILQHRAPLLRQQKEINFRRSDYKQHQAMAGKLSNLRSQTLPFGLVCSIAHSNRRFYLVTPSSGFIPMKLPSNQPPLIFDTLLFHPTFD